MDKELLEIAAFIQQESAIDSLPEMEHSLERAIGYGYRVGELVNLAEEDYHRFKGTLINEIRAMEDETETTRKALLDSRLAEKKKLLQDVKNIATHLKAKRMLLHTAIKTRRGER